MTVAFSEEFVEVGGAKVQVLKGGSGDPLLVLHGTGGNPGADRAYVQGLAERFTVYVPSHPGFNTSERPEWLETIADLAFFYTWFLEHTGLEGTRVIGFSMGGWLAAEIAVMCRHAFSKLMLVDAEGIQPTDGELTDIFLIPPAKVAELSFYKPPEGMARREETPELQYIADRNREMSVRLCWKPYMFDPRLPSLLPRIKIPTRIVWGRHDKIAPLNCGELYQAAIPGSELVVVEECGHSPQLEKSEEFVKLAVDFLA